MIEAVTKRYNNEYLSVMLRISVALLITIFLFAHPANVFAARATLGWDANTEANLAGYNVYTKTGSSPAKDSYDRKITLPLSDLSSVGSPEYEIDNLSDGGTTFFAVTAYDLANNESEFSNVVSYTPEELANLMPKASLVASPSSGEAPLAVSFDATDSDDSDGTLVSYSWQFGDDGVGTGSTPNHTYNSAGIYTVTLEVTDDGGATTTTEGIIIVTDATNQPPESAVPYAPLDGATGRSLTPELQTEDFTDSDGDAHALTQWQISNVADFSSLVLDVMSDSHLTSLKVPDSVLDGFTTYYWRARFYDSRGGTVGWSDVYMFKTRIITNDVNSDGIPDDQEIDVDGDVDNNGIFDVDQMATDATFKSLNSVSGSVQVAVKGLGNVASIESIKTVDPTTIPNADNIPAEMPFGLISMRLMTTHVGDTAVVAVYFSEAAASGAKWYKYDWASGWQDYSPYAIFSADRKSVELELKDGGYGDSDGVENGIIVDPGGVFVPTTASSSTADEGNSGSASEGLGGCFISTVAFQPPRMFHELLSRDRGDGCDRAQPQGVGCEAYLNSTSQGQTPEDARKEGQIYGCNRQLLKHPD